MTVAHLARSRITKALTDVQDIGFDDAETRLSLVRVAVIVDGSQLQTAAGQAAALTAVATSAKSFGHVVLVLPHDASLLRPLPFGDTLASAAVTLGAKIESHIPKETTHRILIGGHVAVEEFAIRCWWNGWCAGVVPKWNSDVPGYSSIPLAGIFAGALAVREVFATVRADGQAGCRKSVVSLWQPWAGERTTTEDPTLVYLPLYLWIVGLGHLGQGYVWSLGFLPATGRLAVLQDDQRAGHENVATGLLTTVADVTGSKPQKTRIASAWLEQLGWSTALIERKFSEDIRAQLDDPAIVLSALDDPIPRLLVAKAGFSYMVDAGVGHGAVDFEMSQIRVLASGDAPTWNSERSVISVDKLMKRKAYDEHARSHDACGTFELASAGVAVPFVGAAIGALVIAQAIRLATMRETVNLLQMELGCPEMATFGRVNSPPMTNLGGVPMNFNPVATALTVS